MTDVSDKPDAEQQAPTAAKPAEGMSRLDLAQYALSPLLIAVLLAVYAASPEFYVKYVLDDIERETQAVEIVTVTCSLLAGVMLGVGAIQSLLKRRMLGAACRALVAAAAIFFGGEEMNWGQTYIDSIEHEGALNLHNNISGMNTLGNLFLICVFFVAPAMWQQRQKLRLHDQLGDIVPRGPVISAMAVAFAWGIFKKIYRMALTVPEDQNQFYMQFVEQVNEQKELLVAVALVLLGVQILRNLRPQAT